jgi:hypothetical protein
VHLNLSTTVPTDTGGEVSQPWYVWGCLGSLEDGEPLSWGVPLPKGHGILLSGGQSVKVVRPPDQGLVYSDLAVVVLCRSLWRGAKDWRGCAKSKRDSLSEDAKLKLDKTYQKAKGTDFAATLELLTQSCCVSRGQEQYYLALCRAAVTSQKGISPLVESPMALEEAETGISPLVESPMALEEAQTDISPLVESPMAFEAARAGCGAHQLLRLHTVDQELEDGVKQHFAESSTSTAASSLGGELTCMQVPCAP